MLMVISTISIIYGIISWIYEGNMKTRCNNINIAWQHELSKPRDFIKESLSNEDPHKEFSEKYNSIKLSKKYETTRLIIFVLYLVILITSMILVK